MNEEKKVMSKGKKIKDDTNLNKEAAYRLAAVAITQRNFSHNLGKILKPNN